MRYVEHVDDLRGDGESPSNSVSVVLHAYRVVKLANHQKAHVFYVSTERSNAIEIRLAQTV
jgi:hypothetical protein